MQDADTYADVCEKLRQAFEDRYERTRGLKVRMTGLVFARPSSVLGKSEFVPNLLDFHHRSGNHIDFFLAGYTFAPSHDLVDEYQKVKDADAWLYSPKRFQEFRREIESRTRWQYSGACDLLLTNARYDESTRRARCDFRTTIVCKLDKMKSDKAIDGLETFFEAVFRHAEAASGDDPTWGFSDAQGLGSIGSALKRVVLSLLPRGLGEEAAKLQHFAVQDVGA